MRRAIDNAAFGRDYMPPLVAFDDLGDQDMAPRTKPWPSAHARVHGIAKRLPHGADVGYQAIRTDQEGPTCCTAPDPLAQPPDQGHVPLRTDLAAQPQRVLTIMARAIHTMPLCFLTRSSSACTCPKSRGCSTRDSCTACPCRPERARHAATSARETQKPPNRLQRTPMGEQGHE